MSLEEKNKVMEQGSRVRNCLVQASEKSICKFGLRKKYRHRTNESNLNNCPFTIYSEKSRIC